GAAPAGTLVACAPPPSSNPCGVIVGGWCPSLQPGPGRRAFYALNIPLRALGPCILDRRTTLGKRPTSCATSAATCKACAGSITCASGVTSTPSSKNSAHAPFPHNGSKSCQLRPRGCQ